jgi:hypothetical protein
MIYYYYQKIDNKIKEYEELKNKKETLQNIGLITEVCTRESVYFSKSLLKIGTEYESCSDKPRTHSCFVTLNEKYSEIVLEVLEKYKNEIIGELERTEEKL